jgi:hypothetical protein
MENPFKIIDARLRNIENMILEMRYPSLASENRNNSANTSLLKTTLEDSNKKVKEKKGGSHEK